MYFTSEDEVTYKEEGIKFCNRNNGRIRVIVYNINIP